MRACGRCLTGGKECKVSDECDKCGACVRLGVSCDLYISPEEIDKVSESILQLQKEQDAASTQFLTQLDTLLEQNRTLLECVRETKVKKERLHKQITLLKKRQADMIRTELQNIKELEQEELTQEQANNPLPDPFNPFIIPDDCNG